MESSGRIRQQHLVSLRYRRFPPLSLVLPSKSCRTCFLSHRLVTSRPTYHQSSAHWSLKSRLTSQWYGGRWGPFEPRRNRLSRSAKDNHVSTRRRLATPSIFMTTDTISGTMADRKSRAQG